MNASKYPKQRTAPTSNTHATVKPSQQAMPPRQASRLRLNLESQGYIPPSAISGNPGHSSLTGVTTASAASSPSTSQARVAFGASDPTVWHCTATPVHTCPALCPALLPARSHTQGTHTTHQSHHRLTASIATASCRIAPSMTHHVVARRAVRGVSMAVQGDVCGSFAPTAAHLCSGRRKCP